MSQPSSPMPEPEEAHVGRSPSPMPPFALIRGIVLLGAGAIALIRPTAAAAALGTALVVVSAIEVVLAARARRDPARTAGGGRLVLRIATGMAAGLALMDSATRGTGGEAGILTLMLIAFAAVDAWGAWRASTHGLRLWRATRAVLALATAAVLAVIPDIAYQIVIFLGGIAAMVIGAVTVAASLDPGIARDDAGRTSTGLLDLVETWLRRRDVGAARRAEIIDAYSYETDLRGKLSRFSILLGLASVIAAAGLVANSVASIIGAMIVAPLMVPIIGIGIGIVTGSPRRAWRSLAVVAGGIAATILIGVAIGAWLGGPTVADNSEVVARTSPSLIDLVVAIAAGAAGAYAVSNTKVADSLPGVAIAISLVPPLATVGILLSQGDLSGAAGASLLFVTNFVSIVIAACAVFALTGVAPLDELQRGAERTQGWFVSFAAIGVLLLIPLAIGTEQAFAEANATTVATAAVRDWLSGKAGYEVSQVSVTGSDIVIEVTGPGAPPDPDTLYASIRDAVGRPVTLRLRVVPSEVYPEASAAPSAP